MRIRLSPISYSDGRQLELVKTGTVLTINGEDFDFAPMHDGDTLPAAAISSAWFANPVEKMGSELVITLWLPNPWNASPEQQFPVYLADVPDGPVLLPQPLPVTTEEQEQRDALIEQVMSGEGGAQ